MEVFALFGVNWVMPFDISICTFLDIAWLKSEEGNFMKTLNLHP